MSRKFQTKAIKTAFPQVHLAYLGQATGLTGRLTEKGLVVEFDDVELALAGVAKAKAETWSQYLRGGGNPRNRRSQGSIFASVARAIKEASHQPEEA